MIMISLFLKPKYGTSNKGIIKFKNLTEFKDFSLDKDKEKIYYKIAPTRCGII